MIRKGNVLLNPSEIVYVIVKKNDGGTYNLTFYFTNKEFLTWTYPTKAEADAALDEFEHKAVTYIIQELP